MCGCDLIRGSVCVAGTVVFDSDTNEHDIVCA